MNDLVRYLEAILVMIRENAERGLPPGRIAVPAAA
jgi:hypothetical protein